MLKSIFKIFYLKFLIFIPIISSHSEIFASEEFEYQVIKESPKYKKRKLSKNHIPSLQESTPSLDSQIGSFPNEIWHYICTNMDSKTLKSVSITCKELYSTCHSKDLWKHRKIELSYAQAFKIKIGDFPLHSVSIGKSEKAIHFKEIELPNLLNFKNLKTLIINGCDSSTNDCLQHVNYLENLETLEIYGKVFISSETITNIISLTQLEQLSLAADALGDEDLIHISNRLTNLTKLSFTGCALSGESLRHLPNLNNLTELNLFSCPTIDDTKIFPIGLMTRLRYLDLGNWENNTNEGFVFLASLVDLTSLSLSGWRKITSLVPLYSLTNLTYLDLTDLLKHRSHEQGRRLIEELRTFKKHTSQPITIKGLINDYL